MAIFHPRTLLIIWLGLWLTSFVATHLPIEPGGATRIPHLDKIAHFSLYFCITYLGGLRMLVARKNVRWRALTFWTFIYFAYGAFDEMTQPITGRHADLDDWLFDALGVVVATVFLLMRWLPPGFHASESGSASQM